MKPRVEAKRRQVGRIGEAPIGSGLFGPSRYDPDISVGRAPNRPRSPLRDPFGDEDFEISFRLPRREGDRTAMRENILNEMRIREERGR